MPDHDPAMTRLCSTDDEEQRAILERAMTDAGWKRPAWSAKDRLFFGDMNGWNLLMVFNDCRLPEPARWRDA